MSKLSEEIFDLRTLERYLNDGTLTREQYEEYLAGLEDCASNADTAAAQMVAYRRSRRTETQYEEDDT
jgi:hypothetical protein